MRHIVLIFFSLLMVLSTPSWAQSSTDLLAGNSPESYKQSETHRNVAMSVIGQGSHRVYIFMPDAPRLSAGKVPLVLFQHGWRGMNPKNFGALIDHLARSGKVVIFPVYQQSAKTSPQLITKYAGDADKIALTALKEQFALQPDPKQVLYLGYSMGSAISLNLALDYQHYQLPAPSALILLAPGDAHHVARGKNAQSIIGAINRLPRNLPLVFMAGDDDPIGLPTARKLAAQVCQIKADRRALLVLPTDQHNGRKVHAGHAAPGAPDSRYDFDLARQNFPKIILGTAKYEKSASLNQLDFYGYWKVIDAILAGLNNKNLPDVVFKTNSKAQTFLGIWEDETPFKEMHAEDYCQEY